MGDTAWSIVERQVGHFGYVSGTMDVELLSTIFFEDGETATERKPAHRRLQFLRFRLSTSPDCTLRLDHSLTHFPFCIPLFHHPKHARHVRL